MGCILVRGHHHSISQGRTLWSILLTKPCEWRRHQLKKLENVAKAVNALEDEISALSDEDLKAQTPKFKQQIENGKSLDDIMPEAFATVREVSKRTLGQRHFDVQLMGGAALHWGNIAEMKTGEGKTLVATLPTYLNASRQRRARGHRQRLPRQLPERSLMGRI